jgi:hypothetical protein
MTSLHVTFLNQLLEFVKNYHVVLPDVLGSECLMSENPCSSRHDKDPQLLLKNLVNVIKAGAYVGYSSAELLQKEKDTLRPVDSVVDKENTKKANNGVIKFDRSFIRVEAKRCKETFKPLFGLLREFGQTYFENIVKKNICAEFREARQAPDIDRFKKWLQVSDEMKDALTKYMCPDMASSVGNDWYTWQMIRLWWAWIIDWASKRNYSGPSFADKDISNDLYDIEYVAYLSRADGLLTGDKKLVKPLAKAAFPDKGVFSSLDEVPEEYACHWS